MLLKRIYDEADLERYNREKEAGITPTPPKLAYVVLAHTGVNPAQNFSIQLVTNGLETGLMEIDDDTLIVHVHPEDLRYKIKRQPGRYCLHCGEKLTDDESGAMARLHVAQKHKGKEGPGYEKINSFETVLDSRQHAKYKVTDPARPPKFHLKEAQNG